MLFSSHLSAAFRQETGAGSRRCLLCGQPSNPKPHASDGSQPSGLPPPALSWESNVVSRASGNWNCLEVNQGPEKLGPRVNYRGNDSGLVSLGMAGPVSQHCSPLTRRWDGEVGPLLPPPLPIPLPLSCPPSPTLRCCL